MTGAARLELHEVSVVRAGARVLDRVSLKVGRGEIVAVIGPNGAGKSTLMEAAIGAVPLAGGAIRIDGVPFGSLASRARALGFLAAEAEPPAEARVGLLLATSRSRLEHRPAP